MRAIGLLCLAGAALAQPYRITGPYTHDNLSIYLVHQVPSPFVKRYLTLQEAMDQKKVRVHETGNVGELAVENVSGEEVFIQGGDIVKGGRQDRVLSNDFILPPRSGRVPVASFCVEQGRWSQRGSEPSQHFGVAERVLPTKELKMAVRSKKDQREVWNKVAEAQAGLATATSVTVASETSPTSLQLTLENKQLNERIDQYVRSLGKITASHKDAVGYAFAIHGEVNSAEVYATPDLFASLWNKLLKASATEAVAKFRKDARSNTPSIEAVSAMLADADAAQASVKPLSGRVSLSQKETLKNLVFELRDGDAWVHRSYITK